MARHAELPRRRTGVASGRPRISFQRDKAFAALVRRQPDVGRSLSFHYEQHGPNVWVSVNVTAPDSKSAETLGMAILANDLPAGVTVSSVEARPLLAEPDFT